MNRSLMPSNLRTIPEAAGKMCGVHGLFYARHFDADTGRIVSQIFRSAHRPIRGHGAGAVVAFEARFDDSCRNGAPSFAITGTAWNPAKGGPDNDYAFIAGGCIHDDIARAFPEVRRLVRWHLTDTRGPMHYMADTVYLAGERDRNGLRAGESRQIITRDGPAWRLMLVAPDGTESEIPGRWDSSYGENAPRASPGRLEWRPWVRVGEGKPRDLDAARRAAVWPDATDAELMAEPTDLRAALESRLPALVDAFRADMTAAGFFLSMPAEA